MTPATTAPDAAGVRPGRPAWLDEPIDRCPLCGANIDRWAFGKAWAIVCRLPDGCWKFDLQSNDAAPTWAEWMAKTANGRWSLFEMGHPLGAARP